jgi:MarR family transcriptional regulator for hemolysin
VKGLRVYGFEMARIAEVYLSTLSAMMKPHGLERNFTALIYLCEHSGTITQNELATALGKDKVSIMRTVDYLCERDFLVRKADADDRRCHILEVTAKAKKILPKVEAAIQKTNDVLLKEFTQKEKKDFEKGMHKLMDVISSMPEPDFRIEAIKQTKN